MVLDRVLVNDFVFGVFFLASFIEEFELDCFVLFLPTSESWTPAPETVAALLDDLTSHVCLLTTPTWQSGRCSRPGADGRSPMTSISWSALARRIDAIFCFTAHTVS